MMDLAAIRKKAKSGKDGSNQKKGGSARRSVEAAAPPTPAAPVPPEVGDQLPSITDPPVDACVDPLDALFNWHPSLEFANEELFFQNSAENKQDIREELRQWLSFSLGEEEYALDIIDIREIIKPREITDIPRAPGFILGILSLRGVIIPVFDLKKRLKLGTVEISPTSRIIVCQQGSKSTGLLVDRISQVVRIQEKAIDPPPAILSGIDRDMVDGVGRYQGKMLILLDPANVMNAELT
jgi:purine-binding chemotaxis protein CheW